MTKKNCFCPFPVPKSTHPRQTVKQRGTEATLPLGALPYLPSRRARIRRRQRFAFLRVISNQVRNVRARLRDFVVQHAPQNVAPNRTRHREANRNCLHLVPGQAVFQVFPDLFFSHNTFLLQYIYGNQSSKFHSKFGKNLPYNHNNLRNIAKF
jgi:hypothetical protein